MKVHNRILCASVVILLICCGTFFLYLYKSNQNLNADFEDTGSYLEGALIIKENGGVARFIENCTNGVYKIAEQHPLYLLVLSTFASRDLSFFPKAKLVSIGFGLLAIAILFAITYQNFGVIYASLAALLLTVNSSFIIRATNVTVETLLIIFVLSAWLFLYIGSINSKWWIAAGIASGLAFATKGSGIFLIGVFALSSLILHGKAIIKNKWFWGFFAAFLLVSLPHLTRNYIVYNHPLYEGILSHNPWMESWDQLSLPQYRLVVDWAEHTHTWEGLPTFSSYIKDHSIEAIAMRFVTGLLKELNLVRRLAYLQGFPLNTVLSYFFVLVAAWALIFDSNKHRRLYTTVLTISFIVPFAWYYPIVPSDRFITPLIPIMIFYFVAGSRRLLQWLCSVSCIDPAKGSYRHAILAGLIFCMGAGQAYVVYQYRNQPFVHPMTLSADRQDLFAWIHNNTNQRSTLLLGPTNRYWGYLWYAQYRGKLIATAGNSPLFVNEPFDTFNQYLKDMSVSHIVIHNENYQQPKALLNYFYLDPDNILRCKETPPRWKPSYHYREKSNHFYIFEIEGTAG